MRISTALVVLALGPTHLGCSAINTVDRPDAAALPAATARPPDRPPSEAEGPSVNEQSFALLDAELNQDGGRWRRIGYDLDGIATRDPASRSCDPLDGAALPQPDGEGGIDNVFGGPLFPLLDLATRAAQGVDLEGSARARQAEGSFPILRLRDWNGGADDPRVTVALFQAQLTTPGTASAPPAIEFEGFEARLPGGEAPPPPRFDGQDWSWVRRDTTTLGDLDQPVVDDDLAYVVGGLLVMGVPEGAVLELPTGEVGVRVRLQGGVLTARIVGPPAARSLRDLTVAGRWSLSDLLVTAEDIGVCRESPELAVLEGQVNRIADIRDVEGTGGEGIPCNAVSVGLRFRGSSIRLAGATPAPTLPPRCP